MQFMKLNVIWDKAQGTSDVAGRSRKVATQAFAKSRDFV